MRKDETILQERIIVARQALEALKNVQPIAGDGWVVYRSTSSNTWDIDLLNVAGGYDRLFKITHVPDDGDTTDGFAKIYGQFDYNTMNNLTYGSVFRDANDPYSWYIRVYGSGGNPSQFRAKFFVFSPKKGTLSITNSAP